MVKIYSLIIIGSLKTINWVKVLLAVIVLFAFGSAAFYLGHKLPEIINKAQPISNNETSTISSTKTQTGIKTIDLDDTYNEYANYDIGVNIIYSKYVANDSQCNGIKSIERSTSVSIIEDTAENKIFITASQFNNAQLDSSGSNTCEIKNTTLDSIKQSSNFNQNNNLQYSTMSSIPFVEIAYKNIQSAADLDSYISSILPAKQWPGIVIDHSIQPNILGNEYSYTFKYVDSQLLEPPNPKWFNLKYDPQTHLAVFWITPNTQSVEWVDIDINGNYVPINPPIAGILDKSYKISYLVNSVNTPSFVSQDNAVKALTALPSGFLDTLSPDQQVLIPFSTPNKDYPYWIFDVKSPASPDSQHLNWAIVNGITGKFICSFIENGNINQNCIDTKFSLQSIADDPIVTPTIAILPKTGSNIYLSNNLRIAFYYTPTEGDQPIHVTETSDKIFVYSGSQEYTQGKYVQVLQKDPTQTLQQALENIITSNGSTLNNCKVYLGSPAYPNNPKYQTGMILYSATNQSQTGCPITYTKSGGISYFLMDSLYPSKLLFFSIGQDAIYSNTDGSNSWENTIVFF